jgi:hypothetical protein
MEWHSSMVTILIASTLIIQISGSLASDAGKNLTQELAGSTLITPHWDPSMNIPSGEEDGNASLNETQYLNLMELVGIQFNQDLEYSSKILDNFVNKEIISRDAMTSTMALFILTRESVDMLDRITPPRPYMQYHNVSKLALIKLEGYLWNMVKYYETNEKEYAIQAKSNFNESILYGDNFKKLDSYNNRPSDKSP